MKSPLYLSEKALISVLAFSCFLEHGSFAQTAPTLSLQLTASNASLTVSGDAGSPCALQFTTNLSSPATWITLANLTLASNPLNIVDPAAPTNAQRYYRTLIAPPTNMVWVPAGSFVMGSPTNEVARNTSELPHTVTFSRGFFIGKFPVTQSNYLSLMNTNPSYFTPGNGFTTDLTRPVERVSWSDATNYCALLTTGERNAGRIFTNWNYRLPTESEWEFACRAGSTNAFYLGTNLLSGMANFNGQFEYWSGLGTVNNTNGIWLGRTTSVGSYPPNALGIYDTAGNVWEWCQDWFGNYPSGSVTDPQGPATGANRVFRGGSLTAIGAQCRSAYRDSANPSVAVNTIGFRVVLAPGP